jgi:hypothetical protein
VRINPFLEFRYITIFTSAEKEERPPLQMFTEQALISTGKVTRAAFI